MVIIMSGMVYHCVRNGYHTVSGGNYHNVCDGYHHVSDVMSVMVYHYRISDGTYLHVSDEDYHHFCNGRVHVIDGEYHYVCNGYHIISNRISLRL